MKKLLLTLALATSFGPNMHAEQEVPAAPVEAAEQNQQEESTLKKAWNSKERKIATGVLKVIAGLGMIAAAVPYLKEKNFFAKHTFSAGVDDNEDDDCWEVPEIEEPSRTAKAMGTVKGFFASPFCKDFSKYSGFERLSAKRVLHSPFNNFTFPIAAGLYLVISGSKDIYKNVADKLSNGESGEPAQDTDSESFTHALKKFWNSTPRKTVSAGAKITGGALALTYYCVTSYTSVRSLSSAAVAGLVTLAGPVFDLRDRFTEEDEWGEKSSDYSLRSRKYTIPFFVGSYLLGSGIRDAVKLKKELADKKKENKDQEPELVPAQ